mmetsp:Transcript_41488/g.93540  ORF Transcript_41488/g.93540 Transcript_41488/m.93540 type:complete len:231 (-) Transcript_41488:953-1645(-)
MRVLDGVVREGPARPLSARAPLHARPYPGPGAARGPGRRVRRAAPARPGEQGRQEGLARPLWEPGGQRRRPPRPRVARRQGRQVQGPAAAERGLPGPGGPRGEPGPRLGQGAPGPLWGGRLGARAGSAPQGRRRPGRQAGRQAGQPGGGAGGGGRPGGPQGRRQGRLDHVGQDQVRAGARAELVPQVAGLPRQPRAARRQSRHQARGDGDGPRGRTRHARGAGGGGRGGH